MAKINVNLGERYGRLVVKEQAERRYHYLCECDCGNTVVVSKYNLAAGTSKSCGCLRSEMNSEYFKSKNITEEQTEEKGRFVHVDMSIEKEVDKEEVKIEPRKKVVPSAENPEITNPFNHDFNEPVYILDKVNDKVACNQCYGLKKLSIIQNGKVIKANCAECKGTGSVESIQEKVVPVYIRSITDKYIVEGAIRELEFELLNQFKNTIINRRNTKNGRNVFFSKDDAELALIEHKKEGLHV